MASSVNLWIKKDIFTRCTQWPNNNQLNKIGLTTKLLRLGKAIIEYVIEKLGEGVSFETPLTIVG